MVRKTQPKKGLAQSGLAVAAQPATAAVKPVSSKFSAGLSALLTHMKAVEPRLQKLAASLGPRSAVLAPTEPAIHVFVRMKGSDAPPEFESLGGSGRGEVRTAIVPMSRLGELASNPGVTRISAPRQLRPLLDIARPLVGVPKFRQNTGSSGQGVIFGAVDSGLDVRHPAFAGRVLSVWDQTMTGTGPGGDFPRLGRVLSGNEMATSHDTVGHGTHVTGIATGALAPFEGVAPATDIIMVKTNFQNTAIAEGVRWIFSEAKRLNRPCVVNLSLGGHGDAHDGSDDLSAAIDQEVGPGRIVVAAAGNEGTDSIHASKVISSSESAAFRIQLAPNSSQDTPAFFILNGWYSGAGTCEVRLKSSTGEATPFQPVLSTDPTAVNYTLQNDQVSIATPPAALNPNGDHQFFISVESASQISPVQGGVWSLEVRQSSGTPGEVHVWLLLPAEAKRNSGQFLPPEISFNYLVGSPGAAGEVITVASYTSRNRWLDSSGQTRAVGLMLNTISDFSSPGPRRDGALKPDVTAPGAMIISCLSSASITPDTGSSIVTQGFKVDAGTSMATPFIAGVVALLLQSNPTLSPAEAKALLKQHSSVPGQAAGTHDLKWGFGLLAL
jgi:subtilisin family serine protease